MPYPEINRVRTIGQWRFCPNCGRPLMAEYEYDSQDPDSPRFDHEEARCSCCQRPWIACPCTPASDGPCQAEIPE